MHLNLDLHPLIFLTTVIFILLAAVMLLMGKAKAAVKGTREWAAGNFISAIGLLLFGLYDLVPDYFSLVLSNTFIVLGICYLIAGIWAFKEKPINYIILFGIPAFTFLQSVLFTNVFTFFEVRKVLFTLAILAGMIILAIESFAPARKPLYIAMRITAVASTLYGFVMIMRLVSIIRNPGTTPLQSTPINISIWILTSVIQISNSIGFLLMFLYKQSMQLQSSLSGMQRFFSIMAHDLRSPIGTISMIAGELENTEKHTAEDEKLLISSMKDTASNTFNLLENLLDWGSNIIGNLHPQPAGFNLSGMLNEEIEIAKSQAMTKQIQIRKDIPADLYAFADENMCHTIVRNLLSNAIKFSSVESSIMVYTEHGFREVSFVVADKGIGMSPEIISNITNSNIVSSMPGTSGEKGYGLGLSFCQNLVEINHGELYISSEPGKGTSIKVKLPAYHEVHGKH